MRVIKDVIHGYIDVPKSYFALIDTPVFQRLRHIEQTSMRCLYPCARHDRFAHSLGVFHLGKLAFSSLIKANAAIITDSLGVDLERVRKSFEQACLLHDSGHAPFSHTTENYYAQGSILADELKSYFQDTSFPSDFDADWPDSPHELVSGIVVMRCFSETIRELGADPELIVRMIIGCKYSTGVINSREHVLNAIIEMLNGRSFDVDKLDYSIRDTWASGIRNVSVDVPRLLGSLRIGENEGGYTLCFDRTSVSVVKSLLTSVDYLYKWIYNHHKVVYEVTILRRSIEMLLSQLDRDNGIRLFFSIRPFIEPIEIGGELVYLPTDGDLRYLMKKHNIPLYNELSSRRYCYYPVWKTYADYNHLYGNMSPEDMEVVKRRVMADGAIDTQFGIAPDKKCIVEVDGVRHGAKPVTPQSVEFLFGRRIENYQKLFPDDQLNTSKKYWLLYIHNDYKDKHELIANYLRELVT